MSKLKSVLYASVFVLLSSLCNPALAAPETGWWWNPTESGRGFFIENHDGFFYLGGYFYDSDGHATWLVAGGLGNADPNHFSGTLYSESKGQTLFGAYQAPTPPGNAGPVTVTFTDDTHGTIMWPGGTIPIVRYTFGSGTADFQPQTGWWWDPSASGSGYSVEVQGGTIFIIGYMYDDSGRPVWYLSAGPMSSPTTYSGPVYQFANGQTMAGPYQPPGAPVTIATLNIVFTAQDAATFTFTETAASGVHAQAAGRTITVSQQPVSKKPGTFVFPKRYKGLLRLDSGGAGVAGVSATYEFFANGQTFTDSTGLGTYNADIVPGSAGDLHVSVTGSAPGCTATGFVVQNFPLDMLVIDVFSNASYILKFNLPSVIVPATFVCTDPPSTTQIPFPFPGEALTFNGAIQGTDQVTGQPRYGEFWSKGAQSFSGGVTATWDYDFYPCFDTGDSDRC